VELIYTRDTQPVLIMRFETEIKEVLEEYKESFIETLSQS